MKLYRAIIRIVVVLIVCMMWYGWVDTTYAQTPPVSQCTNGTETEACRQICVSGSSANDSPWCIAYRRTLGFSETLKLAEKLDDLLSLLYLFARPMMYVAWLAMDNTLVSWELFGITGLLYQFWSVMRTIANFLIIVILVRTVGRQMRKGWDGAKVIGKQIGVVILGGIAINMSWWMLGAMLDISTIAIYGVGMLPTQADNKYCEEWAAPTLIKTMDEIALLGNCRPVLSLDWKLSLSSVLSDKSQWTSYYSYKPAQWDTQYFMSCSFKQGVLTADQWKTTTDSFIANTDEFNNGSKTLNTKYCVLADQLLDVQWLESVPPPWLQIGTGTRNERLIGGVNHLHWLWWERIRTLISSNKGTIGLAYQLYGNMLWFATIKQTEPQSTAQGQIIEFLVKIGFWFAMIFPLLALCIVLMMRIAILWMVVAFAPILVLWRVFTLTDQKDESGILKWFAEWIGKKLTLQNVMNLLFQPVLIVFVLSMGMMFLQWLQSMFTATGTIGDSLIYDPVTKCATVATTKLCLNQNDTQSGVSIFFNFFAYSVSNIIGILLIYLMTFAVMKSSEITSAATEKIKWLGTSLMWSLPVIPWFDGNFVWFEGAKAGLWKAWDTVTEEYEDNTGKTVTQPWVDRISDSWTGKVSAAQSEIKKSSTGIDVKNIEDWTKATDYGKAFIESIKKQSGSVKQATADELVDKTDAHTKALMGRYGARNMLDLMANPQFMAETWNSASYLLSIYAPTNDKWVWYNDAKKKYFDQLQKQISSFVWIWSWNKWYIQWVDKPSMRYVYEKVLEDGKLTELKKVSDIQFDYSKRDSSEELIKLSNKLTVDEFKKLTWKNVLDEKKPQQQGDDWYSIKEDVNGLVVVEKQEFKPKS